MTLPADDTDVRGRAARDQERFLLRPAVWLVFAAFLSFSLVIYVRFSSDSLIYIDVAKNLTSGRGLSTFILNLDSKSVPDRVLLWPPLYPISLAIPIWMGLGSLWAVRVVNILSFMASAVNVYLIGRAIRSSGFGTVCLIVWLFMSPFMGIWSNAMSDALYVAVSSTLLVLLARGVSRDLATFSLLITGVLAGLATLGRYLGVACVLTAIGVLLLQLCTQRYRRKFGKVLFGCLCVTIGFGVLAAPWFLRNLILSGNFEGLRKPLPVEGFATNAYRLLRTLGVDLVLPLSVVLTLLGLSPVGNVKSALSRLRPPTEKAAMMLAVAGMWTAVYVICLFVMISRNQVTGIYTRFLCPAYAGLIPLLLHFGYGAYAEPQKSSIVQSKLALRIVLLLLLALMVCRTGVSLHRLRKTAGPWPLEKWIGESVPKDALFIGNRVWWIRFKTGRPVVETSHEVYPEWPDLSAGRLVRFLDAHGSKFTSVLLVIPNGEMASEHPDPAMITDAGNPGPIAKTAPKASHLLVELNGLGLDFSLKYSDDCYQVYHCSGPTNSPVFSR